MQVSGPTSGKPSRADFPTLRAPSALPEATHALKALAGEQAGLGPPLSLVSAGSKSILQSRHGSSDSANIGPKT